MSVDSEDRLLTTELQDETIISIRGSSEDVIATHTGEAVSSSGDDGAGESQDMETDTVPSSEPVAGTDEGTADSNTDAGTGDINTDELAHFEQSMQNLDVGGDNAGPMNDSGRVDDNHLQDSLTQTEEAVDNGGMSQLFETCSLIETRQNSKFPAKPPATCLMDAQTVSMTNLLLSSSFKLDLVD